MPKKSQHIGASPTRLNSKSEVQYARLLGMCVAAWAHTEEALTLILGLLLGVDHQRAEIVLYASKSEQFRVDLIRQLAIVAVPEEDFRAALNITLNDLLRLVGKRNTYVHGLWKADENSNHVVIPTKAGPIDWFVPRDPVTTKDLRAFYDEIFQMDRRLMEALASLRRASFDRSWRQSHDQIPHSDARQRSKSGARKPRPRSSRE
jgi:hypothetical protein